MTISIILKGEMIKNVCSKKIHCIILGASQGSCAVLAYHVLINEKILQVLLVITILSDSHLCRVTLAYYWKQNVLY